ncbi:MAG TPA: DUF6036 family nucleotidyltransferase [Pyrinomonadaceae bacterium]
MRQQVTSQRLQEFMKVLGDRVTQPTRVFMVGGATAVLLGWRNSTIDIDLKVVPDSDEVLQLFHLLKERLGINIELASPDDFIPELPGWQDRSQFIAQMGKITFVHYDFYAQALAKIERGHDSDLSDVMNLIKTDLVNPKRLLDLFSQIKDQLYRYPAIDPQSFERAVETTVARAEEE